MEFSSLPLSPALLQVVRELGYTQLTPVQAESIPLMLAGRDLIAQSKTGSGKTAAFTLPILTVLAKQPHLQRRRDLHALVLCPTRELCTQVAREIRKLGRREPGLQVLELAGGQPMFSQMNALEKGVHIVVGTPGRVLDHLKRRTLDLRQIQTVVLDEADRMLDMGFEEDMRSILGNCPDERQTVLFSATFPNSIEAMSRAYQHNPARVTIESEPASAPDITQTLIEISDGKKFEGLLAVIRHHRPESAIVFCNLKATVMGLARDLASEGISASGLQGDLEQRERDRVMAKFRNQSTRVLVATDVAARGIDIANLDLVVNFDLPSDPEVYVHRIGRTGRAGQKGLAVSFASHGERAKVERIESYVGAHLGREDLPRTSPQKTGFQYVAPVEERQAKAAAAAAGLPTPRADHQDAKMETLFIAGGRKDKVRPGDILGALTGEAGGLQGSDIGKIEIHDRFSYVAVTKSLAPAAVRNLTEGKIKGRKFRVGLAF